MAPVANGPTLSAILIVKNEEKRLRRCLESIAWVSEIVVVDSGSTDDTVRIARDFTDRITVARDWRGFGAQKNRALDLATGDWVLSIDADEMVSSELRAEIVRAMEEAADVVAYAIPRRSNYCGRFMRHGGWWPDHVVRLFKRGHARFGDELVHEKLAVRGRTARLSAPLVHYSYDSLEEVLDKLNSYSTSAAQQMRAQGQKAGLWKAVSHGCWSFLRTYFLQLGVLDGKEGFMLAVTNAEHSYYRYLKLWKLSQKQ